jgi:hypothetical protein
MSMYQLVTSWQLTFLYRAVILQSIPTWNKVCLCTQTRDKGVYPTLAWKLNCLWYIYNNSIRLFRAFCKDLFYYKLFRVYVPMLAMAFQGLLQSMQHCSLPTCCWLSCILPALYLFASRPDWINSWHATCSLVINFTGVAIQATSRNA